MTFRLVRIAIILCLLPGLWACKSANDSVPGIEIAGPAGEEVKLVGAFGELTFESPLAMVPNPQNNDRYYVLERGGRIFRVDSNADKSMKSLLLDITDRIDDTFEGGFLSIALHPDYANNGKLFISYTESSKAGSKAALNSVVSLLTPNPATGLPNIVSEQRLLELAQPEANHNGGHILFGPDGYLYIGFGDGGGGGDPRNHGQNPATLFGSLLRIDVDSASPYAIPADNPFQDGTTRPEIFAYGLRNPWRFSFDRQTGELWLGDVGQNLVEEVDLVHSGKNYGWNCLEGTADFRPENCPLSAQLEPPVSEYAHNEGSSITGGYVYRGEAIPALEGQYVFGDFISGSIWRLRKTAGGGYARELLLDSGLAISSFAESSDGELFAIDFQGGRVYRLVGTK